MNIDKAIHDYVKAHNYLINIVPDPAILPEGKREFYNHVLKLIESGRQLIEAQRQKIDWLEKSAVVNNNADAKIRQQQVFNLIQLARARGIDVDLVRFID